MLSVIPIIAVSTVLFTLFTYVVTYRQTETQLNDKMIESVRVARLNMQIELIQNANITRNMAHFAENACNTMLTSDNFTSYVQQSIASNPNTVGGGIWFEPNQPNQGVQYFSAYAYKRNGETLVTRNYSDEVNYHQENWYLDGMGSDGSIVWSELYFDPVAGVTMITSTQPFFGNDGQLLGVTTADMALTKIEEIAGKIAIGKTGSAFIIGSDGEFITFLDESRGIMNRIQDDQDPGLKALGQELTAKTSGVTHLTRNGLEKKVYYDTLAETSWKLVVLIDSAEIQSSTLDVLYIIVIPILGMALAIVSIIRVANHLRKIVSKVNSFADRAASGDLSEQIEILEYDEFGVMEDRLNQMILSMSDMRRGTEEMLHVAENANRAKSEFLSRMSHEMRTPMNAILGMTKIASQTEDLEKIKACLAKTDLASRHLLSLINDVLDMSKIESNTLVLEPQKFDLRETLAGVCGLASFEAGEKELTFSVDIASNLPHYVIGDAMRYSQVLMNLLGNAVKFTPSGGQVALTVEKGEETDTSLCILASVADTGIGISQENSARLFDSFEQGDGGYARQFGGTGLGLSISRRLVELMNGSISLTSSLGLGSTFTFTVLFQKPTEAPKESSPSQVGASLPNLQGKTILLAEDLEINREVVMAWLADTHAVIVPAENGAEAIQLFEQNPSQFDLILMDIQMPQMDGLEATRKIRATRAGRPVPIIALTANAFASDVEQALEAGMDDHLAKPINVDLLYQKLRDYLT